MSADAGDKGYRATPRGGPRLRTDVVDVYVFRRKGVGSEIEFLQLRRASEPLAETWQPVMGHAEAGESAADAARRELMEETGLDARSADVLGMWALEQVHPFYIAAIDSIVLSPRFCIEASSRWEPRLNHEHSAHRWVRGASSFMWPGQKRAVEEIVAEIADARSPARERLWVR